MPTVIKVRKLTKRYGALEAVKGISFQVEEGEIFGLLGENGAGKSTTLEMLEGLRKPTSGKATVLGYDVETEMASVKRRIGVQLQASAYYAYLTLKEMLELLGSFYGLKVDALELLDRVELRAKAGSYISQLSGGQKQRFSIIASLVNDPEIVFLDEPTTGLDPVARRNLWKLIADIKRRGKTVVLTTHYLEEAELLCDRIGIMDQGKLVALDKTNRLVEHATYPYVIGFVPTQKKKGMDIELLKFGDLVELSEQAGRYELRLATSATLNEAVAAVQKTLPEQLTVRPASLEDVFIELTGKTIQDDTN